MWHDEQGTYAVGAAVGTNVGGESDGGTEAKDDAQSIESNVDNGDAELVDEGGGQEVEESEEPPDTDK